MRRATYERRRALCARVAAGLEHERKRSRRSHAATLQRFARALELTPTQVLCLFNPTRPTPPPERVRKALEVFSARWPGGPVRARSWWR